MAKTEKEHDKIFKDVMKILKENNLIINTEKSIFKQSEIEIVGYLLKENLIIKLVSDTEVIVNYPVPKNINEVQKFLGYINHYRKFIVEHI